MRQQASHIEVHNSPESPKHHRCPICAFGWVQPIFPLGLCCLSHSVAPPAPAVIAAFNTMKRAMQWRDFHQSLPLHVCSHSHCPPILDSEQETSPESTPSHHHYHLFKHLHYAQLCSETSGKVLNQHCENRAGSDYSMVSDV